MNYSDSEIEKRITVIQKQKTIIFTNFIIYKSGPTDTGMKIILSFSITTKERIGKQKIINARDQTNKNKNKVKGLNFILKDRRAK